jgi:FtsP/CotA-like multicopper oxidase with cupredoxin domain
MWSDVEWVVRANWVDWHGLLMNTSQWMDGVPGISQVSIIQAEHVCSSPNSRPSLLSFRTQTLTHQCAIPPGGSFTYNFKVNNQYGSYWYASLPTDQADKRWHSHYANKLADGLVGG